MDPYRDLGVQKDSDDKEIRAAYRRLSKAVHPDAPGGGNRETFERLTRARDILLDPDARKRFDESGDASGPKVDQTDNEALGVIGTVLGLVLTQDRDFLSEGVNIIKAIEVALGEKRDEAALFVKAGERAIRRVERMRGRFKRRTAGDNLIDGSLAWHEGHLRKGLETNRRNVTVFDRAIEIIKEYDFSPEGGGWSITSAAPTSSTSTMRW